MLDFCRGVGDNEHVLERRRDELIGSRKFFILIEICLIRPLKARRCDVFVINEKIILIHEWGFWAFQGHVRHCWRDTTKIQDQRRRD